MLKIHKKFGWRSMEGIDALILVPSFCLLKFGWQSIEGIEALIFFPSFCLLPFCKALWRILI